MHQDNNAVSKPIASLEQSRVHDLIPWHKVGILARQKKRKKRNTRQKNTVRSRDPLSIHPRSNVSNGWYDESARYGRYDYYPSNGSDGHDGGGDGSDDHRDHAHAHIHYQCHASCDPSLCSL